MLLQSSASTGTLIGPASHPHPTTHPVRPQAATCFCQLSLPTYGDILSLAAGLQQALAHAEGFGQV